MNEKQIEDRLKHFYAVESPEMIKEIRQILDKHDSLLWALKHGGGHLELIAKCTANHHYIANDKTGAMDRNKCPSCPWGN